MLCNLFLPRYGPQYLILADVGVYSGALPTIYSFHVTERMPPLYMASMRFLAAGGILYVSTKPDDGAHPCRKQWIAAGTLVFCCWA